MSKLVVNYARLCEAHGQTPAPYFASLFHRLNNA